MGNLVFPALPGRGLGIKKKPVWSTLVQATVTMRELRIALSSSPVYDFELPYDFLRTPARFAELQQLLGFYNQVLGSWDSWLYSDPTDNYACNVQIGTGDGTTRTFTLTRPYGGASDTVANVNAATVTTDPAMWSSDSSTAMWVSDPTTPMWLAGSGLGAFTISGSQITFTTAPPSGTPVYWSGYFYYRCRFTDDTTEFVQEMPYYYSHTGLTFRGCLGTKI